MFSYLLKRLFLFVPTLIVVSMLSFGLSRMAPSSQVVDYLQQDPFSIVSTPNELLIAEKKYRDVAKVLNLDKPAFYFTITSAAFPDTLYKILLPERKSVLEKLIAQYGNWPEIKAYYSAIRTLELQVLGLPDSLKGAAIDFKLNLRDLYKAHHDGTILAHFERMENAMAAQPKLEPSLSMGLMDLKNRFEKVKSHATTGKLKVPAFQWHGFNNQYHHWLTQFVKGDFGTSIARRRPVADIVSPALLWTLVLNVSAILLAFLIAVPLGVWSAVKKGSRFDKNSSLVAFMLYSLPTFWVGTMLLVFFTTKEYGLDFFTGAWLGHLPEEASLWVKLKTMYPHLVLPIICITYPAVAFIARQARGSMSGVLKQEYIKTARAKGVPESKVIWKHGFRNALFPLITLVASVLPAAIAGSVTIEMIYNIPGLGWTMLQSINEQDWPIVFAIMMLGAVLTITGILLSDILYALADPRVKFKRA
jgi:peptide/nickel transport system permease protein